MLGSEHLSDSSKITYGAGDKQDVRSAGFQCCVLSLHLIKQKLVTQGLAGRANIKSVTGLIMTPNIVKERVALVFLGLVTNMQKIQGI